MTKMEINQIENKIGNKMQTLYRKNDTNVPGEELYDKNGNKLDGTYWINRNIRYYGYQFLIFK